MLSIDQATVVSGWAVFTDGKYVCSGSINLSKCDKESKFDKMSLSLINLLSDIKPDFVIFEKTALQINTATLILLSQLQGIIMGYCILNNIPYFIYSPNQWRKQLGFKVGRGIKRNELKAFAQDYVMQTLNKHIDEDEAESICMGLAYLKLFEER